MIFIGTMIGGPQRIPMPVFGLGYFVGVVLILGNKKLYKTFSFGSPSPFQKRMTLISILVMIILLFLLGGPHFADQNYRLVWSGAFLAVGIHFIPFSFVHGKLMLPLALLIIANSLLGMVEPKIDFAYLSYINVVILAVFGCLFLLSGRPKNIEPAS